MKESDNFLWTCKYGYQAEFHPFGKNITDTEYYETIKSIAIKFNLNDFWGFLMEGQYYIDLWAARFILQEFKPRSGVDPENWTANISLIDDCIETLEEHAESFNREQKHTFDHWMQTVKTYYGLS